MKPEVIRSTAVLVILGAIGAASVLVHQPLLFPTLGPILLVQMETPDQAAAQPKNILIGNALAILAAALVLAALAGHTPPPITSGVLTWQREIAAAVAVTLTFIAQTLLRASHPPAATTALLITLGAINPEWRAILILCTGILLITALGEGAKRIVKAASG